MGLWDRIRGFGPQGYRSQRARDLLRGGDLEGAIQAFVGARQPDEAAKLWLTRAEAEASLSRRMLYFQNAAETALDPELRQRAEARRARLAFDLIRDKGAVVKGELSIVAEQLMAAGEPLLAAEAFAIIGDAEGEIRALTAAGAIERLEERLAGDAQRSRETNQINAGLSRLQDLDRTGERRAALALARELGPSDRRVDDLARVIRQRLVRGPLCELSVRGQVTLLALGPEVTIGRGETAIVVESRALSRKHLRIYRDADGRALAEDLGTRNGTSVGGARLAGPVPVGDRLSLLLGGEIECLVSSGEGDGPLTVEIAGGRYVAPLGPFPVALSNGKRAFVRLDGPGGDEASFVLLETTADAPMFRGGLQLGPRVELALGDEVGAERTGQPVLVVGRAAPA